jgi:hypothetical protein
MKQFIENIKRGTQFPTVSVMLSIGVMFFAVFALLCVISVFLFGPIGVFMVPLVLAVSRLVWLGLKGY